MLEQHKIDGWRRLGAAIMRDAADGDPEAFAQVVALLDEWRDQLPDVAARLRSNTDRTGVARVPGYSWAQIGAALGVTKQSACQRFGTGRRRVDA